MTIATMKLALDALDEASNVLTSDMFSMAAYALRAAIEQAEKQEPVAWLYPEGLAALKAGKCWTAYGTKQDDNNVPIYDAVAPRVEPRASESGAGFESLPASPQWQGLTDEEIEQAWALMNHDPAAFVHFAGGALWAEAKCKEKNHG